MGEVKNQGSNNRLKILVGIAVVVFIAVLIVKFMGSDSSTKPKTSMELKASVGIDNNQFTVTNNDIFDWTSVELEVNGGIVSSGYKLKVPLIKKGETYKADARDFAKSDGTRFNPITMKPQKFTVKSNNKLWYGDWE